MGREQISLAICGGGIGGLCLAASLLSRENASREKGEEKLKIHVYEAAAAFSEIGAGVGFGPNALRAMRLLDGGMEAKGGIWEGYKRCETTTFGSEAERKRFFNFRYGMAVPSKSDHDGEVRGDSRGAKIDGVEQWEEGELIADVRSDTETSSIHRARFLAELVALLPPGCTSVKKRLVGIDEEPVSESLSSSSEKGGSSSGREGGVILHFADGTSARHDAVIGCDGVKSVVRKILLGERDRACEPVFSGKYCYRGLVEAGKLVEVLGEERALDSQMCECLFFSFLISCSYCNLVMGRGKRGRD